MATTAQLDLTVWRNDETWEFPLRIVGPNLTGIDMRAQIRSSADTPGPPKADLALVTDSNAEGVRLAGVVQRPDGTWSNDVRIRLNKTTRQAFHYEGEVGNTAVMAWGLVLAGVTRLQGKVFVPAQVYGSDNAPAKRPASSGGSTGFAAPSSGATLTISQDSGATLVIDGADLLGSEAARVEAAAGAAKNDADRAALEAAAVSNSLKPLRFPNAYPQPSFADGALPVWRNGTPALVPVDVPSLIALGAVHGAWNGAGTATSSSRVAVPVSQNDAGKFVYMSFYVRSVAPLQNIGARSGYVDGSNLFNDVGLLHEQELIETGPNDSYYVYRCWATGIIPAGTAWLSIGRILNQRAPTDYITGITYGISKWPLNSANFFYDKLDPVIGGGDPTAVAKTALGDTLRASWINVLQGGDFVGSDAQMRSGSAVVNLDQEQLIARGYSRGVQWRTTGNEYARYTGTVDITGRHAFAGFFIYSENPANLLTTAGATLFQENDAGALVQVAGQSNGIVTLSSQLQFVWMRGQITSSGTKRMVVGTPVLAVDSTRFATGFTLFLSPTAIDPEEAIRQVFLADKARNQARNYALAMLATAPATDGKAKLVLNGSGEAFVESARSGRKIRNTFTPHPVHGITTVPCRFNIGNLFLDDVAVRVGGGDDIAPDHTFGTTLGGNHGYFLGRCTVAGTLPAPGAVVTSAGLEFVFVMQESATSALIARRNANVAPPVGTYAHPGGSFTVSAVAQEQWYKPHNNYSVSVVVDGTPVTTQSGSFTFTQYASFVEVCDILDRQTIVEWWAANGGANAGLTPAGEGSYRITKTYRFDRNGQLTIPQQWVFLKPTPVVDLMPLQVARINNPTTYVVPGALPFTYDGETLNYAKGVSSARTTTAAGTPSIYFGADKLQATGEFANRVLSIWPNFMLATGILPVADGDYARRRELASNEGLEIRGNTAKLYFHLLDQGPITVPAGAVFECIGYRTIVPREAGKATVYCPNPSDLDAFIYIDRQDFTGMEQVSLPADLIGRKLTMKDSRNAVLRGGLATGTATIEWSAAGSGGYLVLSAAA